MGGRLASCHLDGKYKNRDKKINLKIRKKKEKYNSKNGRVKESQMVQE
jgi:hypothetical protein